MTSIHTNRAAMHSLAAMRGIASSLAATRLSATSGLRVESAKDNAAYWSMATSLRSDMAARAAASDALDISLGLVGTAYEGVSKSIDYIAQMKQKFVLAYGATNEERQKIEEEIVELRAGFISVVQSSSFAGDNWLYKTSTSQKDSRSLVSGMVRNADGTVSVTKTTVDLTQIYLIDSSINNSPLGILSRSNTSVGNSAFVYSRHAYAKGGSGNVTVVATPGTLEISARNAILASTRILDIVAEDLNDAAATLGTLQSGLMTQKTLSKALDGVDRRSIGLLVDADMNATAVRAKALETQQKLAIQALSLANARPQTLLTLFR